MAPTAILNPICFVDTASNLKKSENEGTNNNRAVTNRVMPIIIGTKLFLYFRVVKIE